VALIELCRPEQNFLDQAIIHELADGLEELGREDTRVVVLASRGKNFSAGVDIGGSAPSRTGQTPHIYDEVARLFEQPLPIVCAVQGAAIGAGLGLSLAADFRIAAPEARFSANFVRLGLHHGFGLTVTLPRVVGTQVALSLLYTGLRIGGAEALRVGLCDRMVPLLELREAAMAYGEEIASCAPIAVRSVRETMRAGLADSVRSALVRERVQQELLRTTADFREGLLATQERRVPDFVGR
jgi:2-(1,2-epoxy-1,2-dihydrophenyl)acetyl-CoA isomerase